MGNRKVLRRPAFSCHLPPTNYPRLRSHHGRSFGTQIHTSSNPKQKFAFYLPPIPQNTASLHTITHQKRRFLTPKKTDPSHQRKTTQIPNIIKSPTPSASCLQKAFTTLQKTSLSTKNSKPPSQLFSTQSKTTSTSRWSTRVQGLPTATVWQIFTPLAQQFKAVNLGQGFPDFPGPPFVLRAAQHAIENHHNQYTRVQGHLRLVHALSKFYSPSMQRVIDPLTEVLVTVGATEGLFACAQAFISPGDEVVLIEPFYDAYPCDITLAGGVPKYTTTKWDDQEQRWKLDFNHLRSLLTPKTKMIWLNNPQNVIGKVFTFEELQTLAEICRQHDLLVLSDEVYSQLHYDETKHVSIATLPGMWERTVTLGSAGKSFSVTGFKIGWIFGPADLLKAVELAHVNIPFCATTPLQEAVGEAFELIMPGQPESHYFQEFREEFTRRRNKLTDIVRSVGLKPLRVEGSYFLLTDFSHIPERIFIDSADAAPKDYQFAKWLTREFGVTPIPATSFWHPDHHSVSSSLVRWAFCKNESTLNEAEERLQKLRDLLK